MKNPDQILKRIADLTRQQTSIRNGVPRGMNRHQRALAEDRLEDRIEELQWVLRSQSAPAAQSGEIVRMFRPLREAV